MAFSKFVLSCCLAGSILAAPQAGAPPASALALIESQSDLTVIRDLIKRDPVLTQLYSTVKGVTVGVAYDPAFAAFPNINTPPLNDIYLVRNLLTYELIEGIHPTSAIQPRAQYFGTKLTNSTYVNLSRGNQVARLVELDGTDTILYGDGSVSSIVQGDLRYQGGILHKLKVPVDISFPIKQITIIPIADFYAITNLTTRGYLDAINEKKDVTFFTLSNAAWHALVKSKGSLDAASKYLGDRINDYSTNPGVYYGNSFISRTVQAVSGKSLVLDGFNQDVTKLTVNGVKVAKEDIIVKNGVVHLLSGLL